MVSATALVAGKLRALGSDCYDFLPLSDHRLAFASGNASGESLPAALMIANVQTTPART
jgi:serine phosphatase RsbU (regulator of sigma subunit)